MSPRLNAPMVGTEPAADRLMRSLDYRLAPDAEPLSRAQVAIVLHALADHTAITAALAHRVDESSPWPEATSMGRWLHDVADDLERPAPARDADVRAAVEADLDEPLYRYDGDASQGAGALAHRVLMTLSDFAGPSDLIDAITDALRMPVFPGLGSASRGFDIVASRVRAAITEHEMSQPR